MKDCSNCYWFDKCDHIKVCEDYDPLEDADQIALEEYIEHLRERALDNQEVIDELNS